MSRDVTRSIPVKFKISSVHNPDEPEPKRLLFTAEYAKYAERFFIFYYKPFLLRELCALCGEKNILPENDKILAIGDLIHDLFSSKNN